MLRKRLAGLSVGLLLLLLLTALFGGVYVRLRAAQAVVDAGALAQELRTLRVGISSYHDAKRVAEKYGTAPYEHHYGLLDCRDGYFERCAYYVPLLSNKGPRWIWKVVNTLNPRRHPWNGYAVIVVEQGKVQEYSFMLLFKTSDSQWRGAGAQQSTLLPERAVQARASDSYAISRNDVHMPDGQGFALEATITPNSRDSEIDRAWHFEFGCLSRGAGCTEICEVMPEAWQDFYVRRGRQDAEKFGGQYRFCNDSSRIAAAR